MLVGIQYLRAIAVLLVVFDHAESLASKEKYFGFDMFSGWFKFGFVGVDLFFVLSGFIICYVTLENNTLVPNQKIGIFLLRRFARIVPFMWLCIFLYAVLRLIGRGDFDFYGHLRAFFLWPIGDVLPRQIWTLRHEMLFYFCYGLTFILFNKRFTRFLLVFYLSIPLVWEFFGLYDFHVLSGFVNDYLIAKVNLLFLAGVLVGLVQKKMEGVKIDFGFCWYLVFSVLLVILVSVFDYKRYDAWQVLFFSVFIGFFVLLSANLQRKTVSKFDRFGIALGNASFSIYLLHDSMLSAIFGFSRFFKEDWLPWFSISLAIFFALAFGVLCHIFVEKKLNSFIRLKLNI